MQSMENYFIDDNYFMPGYKLVVVRTLRAG